MSADDPQDPDETKLEDLIFLCLERIEEKGLAAVEELCQAHPEQAGALREHLHTLKAAGLLATPPGEEEPLPERFGEYRVIERLGVGGMGIVLLAEQESLGRRVALKLVRPDRLYSDQARQRFRREIEVVAQLAHPGIVPVYGAGEEQGIPYFVMEHVEGTPLDKALKVVAGKHHREASGVDLQAAVLGETGEPESGNPDLPSSPVFDGSWSDTCLRIVRQVAEALEHAHRRGVLHRDVKPSNVVITPTGRAMLLDFGLALKEGEERMTRTGAELGSLPYMAPERLGHEESSGVREDVYALGVLLYECLAMRLPYEGKSSMEILQLMQTRVAPPLRRFAPGVSADCETVCLVAMDHDPARRYGSAEAFARDLTHILEGRPIEARRANLARRSLQWCQRNPAAAVAWGLGTLILVGGPIVYGEQQRSARERIEGINLTLRDANERIENQNSELVQANEQIEAQNEELTSANQKIETRNAELRKASQRIEAQNTELKQANEEIEEKNAELTAALTEAEAQRNRATRHFGMAVGSIRFLTDVALDELIDVPQAAEAKRKMLAGALEFFGQFLAEAQEGDLESRTLRIEVARADRLTGDIQLHLGEAAVGEEHLQSAAARYAALIEEEPTPELQRLYAGALADLGRMHILKGRLAEGQTRVSEAIDLYQACLKLEPDNRTVLFGLQEALSARASLLADQGKLGPTIEGYRDSLSILDRLITTDTGYQSERYTRAKTRNRLGEIYRSSGRIPDAGESFALALEELDALLDDAPARVDYRSEKLGALSNLGNARVAQGEYDEALDLFELAMEFGEQLVIEFPGYDNNFHLLAVTYANCGGLLGMMEKTEESLEVTHKAEEMLIGLIDRNPTVTRYQAKLAGAQANLGFSYLSQGEAHRAAEYLVEANSRAANVLEYLTGEADTLETFLLSAVGLGYARESSGDFEGMLEAVEVLLDSPLDPQRLTRGASLICDLADEIHKREDLEADLQSELHERLLDCAEELVHLAFDGVGNPAPVQRALQAPNFAPLRERPAIADRMGG